MTIPDSTPPVTLSSRLAAQRLRRTIETEIVPRLLLSHGVGPLPPRVAAAIARQLTEEDVARFTEILCGQDEESAQRFSAGLVERGVEAESIYLDLLAPAARALGKLWDDDRCDFVQVTVALGRIQRILRSLSRPVLHADTNASAGAILLATVPTEQHSLGLFMVAEFFIRAGWAVRIGAPLAAPGELDDELRGSWYDVIGYSVACDASLTALKRDIRRVRRLSRNGGVRVMVGGRLFNERPELVSRVGADGTAADARGAPLAAEALL